MSTSRLQAAVALILVTLATSACGDDGPSGPSFDDSVSTAAALSMAGAAANAAAWTTSNLNFGGLGYGAAAPMAASVLRDPSMALAQGRMRHLRLVDPSRLDWRAALLSARTRAVAGPQTVDDGCTFSGHGIWDNNEEEWVDANNNDIPDDMLFEYSCREAGEGTEFETWSWHVSIKEIPGSLWGFTLRWKAVDRWDSGDGDFEVNTYEQGTDIDVRAESANSAQAFKWTYVERYDGVSWGKGTGESWNTGFDPDAAIALGFALPDGDLTLSGRKFYYNNDDDTSISFALSTTTPLAYSSACALANTDPPFTAGSLHGELNGNSHSASFDVTFTSCGNYSTEVNGAFDEPVEALSAR